MADGEPRCKSRHLHTGKRCILVPGHMTGHRWWRVRDPERPSWMDGEGRIEWFEDEEVRDG